MLRLLRKLFRPRLRPMNVITISKKNILHNYDYLASLQEPAVMFPVLKSNAYGHGLEQAVRILNRTDAEYLVVDSYPEYVIAKKYSSKPILLLGETLDENYKYFDLKRTTFCVYNLSTLQYLADRWKELNIHIFINTWMNREWLDEHQLPDFLDLLEKNPQVHVTGVMSHLHSADEVYYDQMDTQIQQFKKLYLDIINRGHTPLRRHIGNTAGIMKITDDFFNAYRPWIWLFGYNPLSPDDKAYVLGKKLKPAMTITSRVVWLHDIAPGEWVSYNHAWKTGESSRVAVIPFGYAEGLPRGTSNRIVFKSWRKYFRQVGNICMNICMCQVDDGFSLWEEIEIVAADVNAKNTMYVLAQESWTIVYETLVRLDKGIRREID